MYLTEKEAMESRFCPYGSFTSKDKKMIHKIKCSGSACMCWRWANPLTKKNIKDRKPNISIEPMDNRPIEQYERFIEDLHDLAVVAERWAEKLISFEEVKRRLKDDGIL